LNKNRRGEGQNRGDGYVKRGDKEEGRRKKGKERGRKGDMQLRI